MARHPPGQPRAAEKRPRTAKRKKRRAISPPKLKGKVSKRSGRAKRPLRRPGKKISPRATPLTLLNGRGTKGQRGSAVSTSRMKNPNKMPRSGSRSLQGRGTPDPHSIIREPRAKRSWKRNTTNMPQSRSRSTQGRGTPAARSITREFRARRGQKRNTTKMCRSSSTQGRGTAAPRSIIRQSGVKRGRQARGHLTSGQRSVCRH